MLTYRTTWNNLLLACFNQPVIWFENFLRLQYIIVFVWCHSVPVRSLFLFWHNMLSLKTVFLFSLIFFFEPFKGQILRASYPTSSEKLGIHQWCASTRSVIPMDSSVSFVSRKPRRPAVKWHISMFNQFRIFKCVLVCACSGKVWVFQCRWQC